jgi:hypothetical protein
VKAQEHDDPEKRKEVTKKYKARTREGSQVGNKRIPCIDKIYFLLQKVQTGSGAHPVSNLIGTGFLSRV